MKLTLICPCWGRPERTLRAIDSVIAQDFDGYEAIFIGDCCPFFQKRINDGTFQKYTEIAASKGNTFIFKNLTIKGGGWGHLARKEGIDIATGEYICFLDNDDVLKPDHLTSYYSFMKDDFNTDVGYLNAYTVPWKKERNACLSRGGIGNAELIFKAQALKNEYQLDNQYEHDWRLVERMLKKKYVFKKSKAKATYMIMSIPNAREKNID